MCHTAQAQPGPALWHLEGATKRRKRCAHRAAPGLNMYIGVVSPAPSLQCSGRPGRDVCAWAAHVHDAEQCWTSCRHVGAAGRQQAAELANSCWLAVQAGPPCWPLRLVFEAGLSSWPLKLASQQTTIRSSAQEQHRLSAVAAAQTLPCLMDLSVRNVLAAPEFATPVWAFWKSRCCRLAAAACPAHGAARSLSVRALRLQTLSALQAHRCLASGSSKHAAGQAAARLDAHAAACAGAGRMQVPTWLPSDVELRVRDAAGAIARRGMAGQRHRPVLAVHVLLRVLRRTGACVRAWPTRHPTACTGLPAPEQQVLYCAHTAAGLFCRCWNVAVGQLGIGVAGWGSAAQGTPWGACCMRRRSGWRRRRLRARRPCSGSPPRWGPPRGSQRACPGRPAVPP